MALNPTARFTKPPTNPCSPMSLHLIPSIPHRFLDASTFFSSSLQSTSQHSVVASKRARGATRPFQSRELARRIATGKERRTTYRSCAEKSSLVSSSSHDSSHRCCVSPPLAASVSSASQSACTTLSVILSWDTGGKGWEGKKGAHTLNREILKLVILLQSGGALLLLGGGRRHGRLVGRFGVFLLLLGGCGGHGCFGCGHGGGRGRRRWEVVLWWGWWW